MITIGAIALVVVLASCGFASWLLVKGGNAPVGPAIGGPSVVKRDITSRERDNQPLKISDVFPDKQLTVGQIVYPMIGEAQANDDCRLAASEGDMRNLVVTNMCSQVVRASFKSSDGTYFVTGGVLNFPDADTAVKVSTSAKDLVSSGKGRFTGYVSDPAVDEVLYSAAPNLAWEVRGHFFVYTVIVRADGADIAADDQGAPPIVYDVLKKYLRDTVIENWSIDKSAMQSSTAAAPSASAG
jgi:hypothetical protein